MQKYKLVGVAFVAVLLAGAPGYAQQKKGDTELIANVSFNSSFTSPASGSFQVTGILGYFYTEQREIIGGLVGGVTFGGGTQTNIGALFGYRYNLKPRENGKMVPYVGGDVFVSDFTPSQGTGVADITFADGQVGVKYYLNRNVAIDGNVSIGFALGDFGTVGLSARMGLAYLFPRKGQ